MSFHQEIRRCDDHVGCNVIDCYADDDVVDHETGEVIHPAGTVVWESHDDRTVAPAVRINPDIPAFENGRRVIWRSS